MVGYQRTHEMKLIRTEHRVIFKEGMNAQAIKEYLSKVPDNASLIELDLEEGIITLLFRADNEENSDD